MISCKTAPKSHTYQLKENHLEFIQSIPQFSSTYDGHHRSHSTPSHSTGGHVMDRRDLLDMVKEEHEKSEDICGESFIFALGRMAQNLDHTIFEDEEGNHTEEYNELASFIFDVFMWARAVQDNKPTPVIWDMENDL